MSREVCCHRCEYEWLYRGKNQFAASCPQCKTSVTFTRSDARLAERRGEIRQPAPTNLHNRPRIMLAVRRA